MSSFESICKGLLLCPFVLLIMLTFQQILNSEYLVLNNFVKVICSMGFNWYFKKISRKICCNNTELLHKFFETQTGKLGALT